jgi:hypothetical protein
MPNSSLRSIAHRVLRIAPSRRIGLGAAGPRPSTRPYEAVGAGAVALAFIGAAIGFVGCAAALLRRDPVLALAAFAGAAFCVSMWQAHLSDDDLREPYR